MTSSRDSRLPGWLIPLATGLLAALSAASGTFALWHDTAQPVAEVIRTGHLAITELADPVWQDTSHRVPREIDPADFPIRRGDTLQVDIPVKTTLDGTNLTAQLAAQLAEDAALPTGVRAHYQLLDAHGTPLTAQTLPLGQTSAVSLVHGAHYTVRVSLDFTAYHDDAPLAMLHGIDVVIHQVRDGNDPL